MGILQDWGSKTQDWWDKLAGKGAETGAQESVQRTEEKINKAMEELKAPEAPKGPRQVTGVPSTFEGGKIRDVGQIKAPDLTRDKEFKQIQLEMAQRAAGMATGQALTTAEQAGARSREALLAQQMAQTASVRGPSSALQARTVMQTGAEQQRQIAEQTAITAAQERQKLMEAALTGAAQGRQAELGLTQVEADIAAKQFQGDIQTAIAQGQLDQETAKTMFNAAVEIGLSNAQLGARYDELVLQYANAGLDAANAKLNALTKMYGEVMDAKENATKRRLQKETSMIKAIGEKTGFLSSAGGSPSGAEAGAIPAVGGAAPAAGGAGGAGGAAGAAGGAASAAPMAAAASDIRVKKNIKDGSKDIQKLLDAISAKKYEYKGSDEERVSPMAQDLEKTKLGKSMVKENKDGVKIVDYGAGFGTIMAAQADLNKRMKAIEAALKSKKKGK